MLKPFKSDKCILYFHKWHYLSSLEQPSNQAQKLKLASADSMGYVTTIYCMKKPRQRKDFLKKATFEEINFRKKTYGGIYLYKTWTARFVIQCSRVLGFFQILQDSVTYFVYFCQFGNFLLISSCCFVENFWLFHARNGSNVAHIFC